MVSDPGETLPPGGGAGFRVGPRPSGRADRVGRALAQL